MLNIDNIDEASLKKLLLYISFHEDRNATIIARQFFRQRTKEILEFLLSNVGIDALDLDKWYLSASKLLMDKGIGVLYVIDDDYPVLLREISTYPLVLYYRGERSLFSKSCVSIVGSRKLSYDGKKTCDSLVRYLSKFDVCVVSGLAFGTDAMVHLASLRYKVHAISVLPTAVDNPIPKSNLSIANSILSAGGLLISEKAPGYQVQKHSYVERNRIISGISDRTLIVEAAIKSGSMSTAEYAIEQNRELFALPGSISNPVAEGCNYLIHCGATPLYRPEIFYDIEGKINGKETKTDSFPESGELSLLSKIKSEGRVDIEQLKSQFKISDSEFFSKISEYELLGKVTRNGRWVEYSG